MHRAAMCCLLPASPCVFVIFHLSLMLMCTRLIRVCATDWYSLFTELDEDGK